MRFRYVTYWCHKNSPVLYFNQIIQVTEMKLGYSDYVLIILISTNVTTLGQFKEGQWLDQGWVILCLTVRTTVTSAHIPEEDTTLFESDLENNTWYLAVLLCMITQLIKK